MLATIWNVILWFDRKWLNLYPHHHPPPLMLVVKLSWGWSLPSSSSSQWSLPELSAGSWASNWQCGAEMVNNNRRKTAEVRRPASTAATAAIASIYSFYNCYEHQSETIFYCSAPALTFLLFSYIAWSLCWNTTTFNFCAFACAAVQVHSVQVFYSINWLHSFLSCCDNL